MNHRLSEPTAVVPGDCNERGYHSSSYTDVLNWWDLNIIVKISKLLKQGAKLLKNQSVINYCSILRRKKQTRPALSIGMLESLDNLIIKYFM